jgi:branched-chain amino acid transport system substrate-binding protein
MYTRHGRRARSGVTAVVVALATGACSIAVAGGATAGATTKTTAKAKGSTGVSLQCAAGLGTGSPGVTSKQINVAAISSATGPLSAEFAALVPGAEAYFDMIDARGGVNGRKVKLTYNLNDQGTDSRFETLTHTAIDQDHAFAVIVSSYWFSPTYFASTCTPTYGYNVTGDWTGPPNLFGTTGSVQTYRTIVPAIAYLTKKVKAKSVAVLAYGVSSSSGACQAAVNGLGNAGYTVSYSDLKITPGNPDLTPDVQRIREAGSDFILSCMTVDGNVALAREVKQYGLKVKQLWLTVADQSVVSKDSSLLQGVYFNVGNVPIQANQKFPGTYPGLAQYLTAMKKYEPAYTGDNIAIEGWASAALLVAGIRAAGKDLTQANVVKVTNQMTTFTAGGLFVPINWTVTHTRIVPPNCTAFEQVQGTKLQPVLGKGKQVFLCFGNSVKNATPVPAKPGTPGPTVS